MEKNGLLSRTEVPLRSDILLWVFLGFPGGSEVKASARNAGDMVRSLGREDSPGEGNGNPLQYSCLENPMDGGVCPAEHNSSASWNCVSCAAVLLLLLLLLLLLSRFSRVGRTPVNNVLTAVSESTERFISHTEERNSSGKTAKRVG
ncbi:hypothetical protein MG293_000476 [Ovis ammon polii]|uniref:Uncharacterized protein n=1 Tax=Ovis ammon polii TaxID=230172 RepID=A0AAD4UMY0_OVIAM|nr:hypothetical protein MG293_000476 [Ovis ammon polii]